MNTTQVMTLINDGATIDGSYIVHPSFKNGKRKLSKMIYWAVYSKCLKEKIIFPATN